MADKMFITLEVDDKGTAVVKKFDRNTQDAFNKVKKNAAAGAVQAGRMKRAWTSSINSIKKHWKGLTVIGVAGIYGITKAITGSINKIKEYVGIANVQEAAETRLAAVVKATGQAAGFTADEMFKMAAEMQKITTVGDEVAIAGMAILATFKQIQGEGFKRTMLVAADMSEVMQTDLKSSLVMIGKAMNDPIANLSAMSRAGVQFSKQQKDQIKVMWEAGNTAAAQAIILKELEAQFGGAAAAARDIFGGAVKAAGNALGDMKEELGFVITKNQFFIELAHLAEQQFISWGEAIKNNRQYLGELAKGGVMDVVNSLVLVVDTMRFFHNGWLGIKLVANAAIVGIIIGLDTLFKALRFVLAPLDAIFAGLVMIGQIEANPFDKLQQGASDFAISSMMATSSVLNDIKKTNKAYDSVIAKVEGWKKKIAEVPVTQAAAASKIEATVPKFKIDPVANTQLDDVKKKAKETADAIEGMKPTFSVRTVAPTVAAATTTADDGAGYRTTTTRRVSAEALRQQIAQVELGRPPSPGMFARLQAEQLGLWRADLARTEAIEARVAEMTPTFQTGTGPEGLPHTGLFHGHKGEIVKSPEESAKERRGKTGNTYQITIAPTFMTGDSMAGRRSAIEIKRQLEALGVRFG